MIVEIIEQPIRFCLYGFTDVVKNDQYAEAGMQLMNALWPVVKATNLPTTGINHWVYMPEQRLFVGVELLDPTQPPAPDLLQTVEFELPRHLKHVHVGPYQTLPQKWQALLAEITHRGEKVGSTSLEIYGHHSDDPSKNETTILIGLEPNQQS